MYSLRPLYPEISKKGGGTPSKDAMKTQLIPIESAADRAGISQAAALLQAGGRVAIPTETVYGLAANALDGEAVKGIFAAKGRPADNPLIVHIAALSQWDELVTEIPDAARRLAQAYWPGPLTIILPKSPQIPDAVSGGLPTVAVRMPSHPVAAAIIEACGLPLAAPSANRSGRPSPTDWQRCLEDLDGRVEGIVQSSPCQFGVESTVVTLAGVPPRLLRPGAVTLEMLEQVLGPVEVDDSVLHQLQEGAQASSPGMKYKHYAPKCQVILVEGTAEDYVSYVNQRAKGAFALCFAQDAPKLVCPTVVYGGAGDDLSQARALFDALRRLDEEGAVLAYAHAPEKTGVGLAVYNRLIRACGFQVVQV